MAKVKYKVPTAKDLLDSGVHFGHQVRRWHPEMEPYIYTVQKNIHIIDLGQTEELLKEACEALYAVAAQGKQIIFVGTKRQAREMVQVEAKRCGAFYVSERWLGGTITNFGIIKKNIDKLTKMRNEREEGVYEKYTKKERLLIDRNIERLERSVGGLVGLKNVPSAIFVIDARREKTAIREAALAKVEVSALVDTNTNPELIDHIIPGNDDGIKSVATILGAVANAVEAGYKEYAVKLEKGEIEEKPAKKEAKKDDKSEDKGSKSKAKDKKETKSTSKKAEKSTSKAKKDETETKVTQDEAAAKTKKTKAKDEEMQDEILDIKEEEVSEEIAAEIEEVEKEVEKEVAGDEPVEEKAAKVKKKPANKTKKDK